MTADIGMNETAKKLDISVKNIKRWSEKGAKRKEGIFYIYLRNFYFKINSGGGRSAQDPEMENKVE